MFKYVATYNSKRAQRMVLKVKGITWLVGADLIHGKFNVHMEVGHVYKCYGFQPQQMPADSVRRTCDHSAIFIVTTNCPAIFGARPLFQADLPN